VSEPNILLVCTDQQRHLIQSERSWIVQMQVHIDVITDRELENIG
jgi:hypothetical protein